MQLVVTFSYTMLLFEQLGEGYELTTGPIDVQMLQRMICGRKQRLYRAMGVRIDATHAECSQLADGDGGRRGIQPLHKRGQMMGVKMQKLELSTRM